MGSISVAMATLAVNVVQTTAITDTTKTMANGGRDLKIDRKPAIDVDRSDAYNY